MNGRLVDIALDPSFLNQIIDDRAIGRLVSFTFLDQRTHDSEITFIILVDEVDLTVCRLTVDRVLARRMEMILLEFILDAIGGHR